MDDETEAEAKRLAAYLSVSVAALLVIVYVIYTIMPEFIIFTSALQIPGQHGFLVGTVISFLVITFVMYYTDCHDPSAGMITFYILFLVFYIIWTVNLSVAAEAYNKGAKPRTHAGFYLSVSTLCLLILLYWGSEIDQDVSLLLIVPIWWCVYLLYKWWFRFHPCKG